MQQLDRILKLHRILSGRRNGIGFDQLLLDLDCKRTTLQRAISTLRDALHAPLINDRSRGGWRYEGESHYELPGLWFSADELAALLVLDAVIEQHPLGLLGEALRPARARIEKLLEKSGVGVPDWRSRLRLLRMTARSPGTHFTTVADALVRRRRLCIHYHARSDDRMAPRSVSPQRLTLYRDNWYLDAWCHRRDGLRIFAMDRIVAVDPLEEPTAEVPAEALDQTLATSYGIFAGTPSNIAILRFTPHAARWVASETWHPQQQDQRDEDGTLTRHIPYHRTDELVMDVLRHGPDVEVLAPQSLREEVVRRLRGALDRYAPLVGEETAPAPALLAAQPSR